jgi:hypothetical protein
VRQGRKAANLECKDGRAAEGKNLGMPGHFYLQRKEDKKRNHTEDNSKEICEPAMSKQFFPQNYRQKDLRGRVCRVTMHLALLAVIFQFSCIWTSQAHANDLAMAENVAIVLEKRIQKPFIISNIPIIGESHLNLYIIPREEMTWSNNFFLDVIVPYRHQRMQSNGKVMVAGGVGKGIFAISAELYDSTMHSWLTKGTFNTGRWQHSSVLPLNGRVLVWLGMVVPF